MEQGPAIKSLFKIETGCRDAIFCVSETNVLNIPASIMYKTLSKDLFLNL